MLGSMGLASWIGLGISLYNKGEVVVLDGDGSLLMNPNALCSIAQQARDNLTVVALDNGHPALPGISVRRVKSLTWSFWREVLGSTHN